MFCLLIAILILILFILLLKLKFQIAYTEENGFNINLKILFFKLKLLAKNEKKNLVKKKSNSLNKKKAKHFNKKKSFADVLKKIKLLLKPAPKLIKMILRRIEIRKLNVDWAICEEDAFKTATKFGGCSAVFFGLLRIFKKNGVVKVNEIKIYPQFNLEKTKCNVFFILQISVFWLVFALMAYVFGIFKMSCSNEN